MITLKEFVDLEEEAKTIRKIIKPETDRLHDIGRLTDDFNHNLLWSVKNFISQKLWDNMDSDTKEKVEKYRDELDKMLNPPKHEFSWATTEDGGSYGSCGVIYAIPPGPFDPFHDEWWIFKTEKKDGKVRIGVSCRKNEGSISGLVTFVDEHWTDWFDEKEIDNI